MTNTTATATTRKLKILALHGWRQHAERFRMRTGAFRKLVKREADFYFLDAPFEEPNLSEQERSDGTKRLTWFMPNEDRTVYRQWQDSILYLRDYLYENGPFDGVLGFSQGTSMALLLAALQNENASEGFGDLHAKWREKQIAPLKFVILVGAFVPRDAEMAEALERVGAIEMPSLHMMGEQDEAIKKEVSQQVMQFFRQDTRKEILHTGGHVVPHGKEVKQATLEFFEPFTQEV